MSIFYFLFFPIAKHLFASAAHFIDPLR